MSSTSIKDNNIDLDNGTTVIVTNGLSKTLTCVPSLCRPAATVTWYIGGVQKASSNTSYEFTFTPTENDHNKSIYCTALNLQTTVTSKKAVLDVTGMYIVTDYVFIVCIFLFVIQHMWMTEILLLIHVINAKCDMQY